YVVLPGCRVAGVDALAGGGGKVGRRGGATGQRQQCQGGKPCLHRFSPRARPSPSPGQALERCGKGDMAMAGLWLDEFTVGQVFDHPLRRTVTETDNLLMSALTHNSAPLHLDAEYMKGTEC